jgi:acylphosphatase
VLQTVRITVTGRVQGVYYRQSAKEKADLLRITGVVQNNPDKTVTIIATGDEIALALFKDWCKTGPPHAVVSTMKADAIPLVHFDRFLINR